MRTRGVVGLGVVGFAGMAAALTLLDAAVDAGASALPARAMEFLDRLMMIGAMFASPAIVLHLSRLRARTDDLEGALARATHEGRQWRAQSRRFLDGLSRAVEAQFDAWSLTPAEADVAGLLLKGASQREIAVLRRTSEATIRQQAQNVYRKSGLGSRSELAAYFLEDLFSIGEVAFLSAPEPAPRYDA